MIVYVGDVYICSVLHNCCIIVCCHSAWALLAIRSVALATCIFFVRTDVCTRLYLFHLRCGLLIILLVRFVFDAMLFALGLREKQSIIFWIMVSFIGLHVNLAGRISCTSFGCLATWNGLTSHQVVDIGAIVGASTSASTTITMTILKLHSIAAQGHRLNFYLTGSASRFGIAGRLWTLPLVLTWVYTIHPRVHIDDVFLDVWGKHGVAFVRLWVDCYATFIDKWGDQRTIEGVLNIVWMNHSQGSTVVHARSDFGPCFSLLNPNLLICRLHKTMNLISVDIL